MQGKSVKDVQVSTNHRQIDNELIAKLKDGFERDEHALHAQNAVINVGLDSVALNQGKVNSLKLQVSNQLDDWKVSSSQGSSGRCWIFSALNLLRANAMKHLNTKNFEFSQTYTYFWDKFERINYFLEDIEATFDIPIDSQIIEFILDSVTADGGQWLMANNLFNKYGVVPKDVMPETWTSTNTLRMRKCLQEFLRYAAREIRHMKEQDFDQEALDSFKSDILAKSFRILAIHLGTPPTTFTWQYKDDNGNFHKFRDKKPRDFFKEVIDLPLDDYICLVDDPRNPKKTPLIIEHLGNVWGAPETAYMNTDINLMKDLAKEAILSGEPVWFGSDVSSYMSREHGVWANDLYNYNGIYDIEFELTKEDRIRYMQSKMTHAMLFTGVDIDHGTGKVLRWRVENSWGEKSGNNGFYIMEDSWFDEYVFEVTVRKAWMPKDYQDAFNEEPIRLPAWDPMGSLA
jgi:bleomycin hydrolase